jgi:hypothetical protein
MKIRWNILYQYKQTKKNCQDFCQEVLECLGIDTKNLYNKNNAYGKFITEIK